MRRVAVRGGRMRGTGEIRGILMQNKSPNKCIIPLNKEGSRKLPLNKELSVNPFFKDIAHFSLPNNSPRNKHNRLIIRKL